MATARTAVWALLAVAPWMAQSTCLGDGTEWENPDCRTTTNSIVCMGTLGCNWDGKSFFRGWCTGGPRCPTLSSRTLCGRSAGCSWIPSSDAPRSQDDEEKQFEADIQGTLPEKPCRGDGTEWENALCRQITNFVGCTATPGCNWAGLNMFGGWCSGAAACNFRYQQSLCASAVNCTWVVANATVVPPGHNVTEPNPEAIMAKEEEAAAQWRGCRGAFPWCYYIGEPVGCMWTPGCDWSGRSHYRGQCRGGSICWPQTGYGACEALRPCWWEPYPWAFGVEANSTASEEDSGSGNRLRGTGKQLRI